MPGFFTRVRPEWSLLPELMSRVALCYTRAPNGITVSESRTRERQYHQRLPLSSSPYPRVAAGPGGATPPGPGGRARPPRTADPCRFVAGTPRCIVVVRGERARLRRLARG